MSQNRKGNSKNGAFNDANGSSEDEVLFKRVEPTKQKKLQENVWELGGKKRASILEFKGKRFVDIREYYEKDGEILPGKKGICLNLEQFQTILDNAAEIKEKFNAPKK